MEINKRKLKQLNKRLKGWHKHFKGRFLLLKDLTEGEYILWDFSFSVLADWDKTHEGYGTFTFTNAEIGHCLQRDASIVSRRSKKLFELGLWKKCEDGSTEVRGMNITEHLTVLTKDIDAPINLQDYLAFQQSNDAITNTPTALLQENVVKENDSVAPQSDANMHNGDIKESLISSKDESNVSIKKVIVNNIRTDKEYQKVYEDNGYKGFSPQEMRDVDESLPETLEVTDENEQWIVETYFKGNWEEYKKSTFMGKKKLYE